MIRRILTLTLFVSLLASPSAFAALEGAWTATVREDDDNGIYLSITRDRFQHSGRTMRISDFAGLTRAATMTGTSSPVQFQLQREAGTIRFDGSFRKGNGAGQFTFESSPSYVPALRALGLDPELQHAHTRGVDETLFQLALHDVSTAFIRSMQAEGFRTSLDRYLAMRIFDVTPAFVREMRNLGFANFSADDAIASRIHKVTPEYVRSMRAAGWDLKLSELQSSRIHGASPEFAAKMSKLGYTNLRHDELVSFRIHKVTPEYIRELRELGYADVPARKLISMRIHRVTPGFIRELRDLGFSNVPVDKLISMKIHRIDPKLVKALAD